MADSNYQWLISTISVSFLSNNYAPFLGYAGNIRMIDDEDEVGQK